MQRYFCLHLVRLAYAAGSRLLFLRGLLSCSAFLAVKEEACRRKRCHAELDATIVCQAGMPSAPARSRAPANNITPQ